MRCTHCGAMIPDDMLYCPECHMEVQIVPDYNPLEDVLAQEVKGSIEDATRQIRTDDIRRYRRDGTREYSNSTRVLSQGEMDEIRARRNEAMRQGRQSGRSTAGSARQSGSDSRYQTGRTSTGSMRQTGRNTTGSMRQTGRNTSSMRQTGRMSRHAPGKKRGGRETAPANCTQKTTCEKTASESTYYRSGPADSGRNTGICPVSELVRGPGKKRKSGASDE